MLARRTDADVVVVGGGPAGASVAGLLALRSHRVLLLHDGRAPATGRTTLFTGLRAVANELGLLGRLDATADRRCSGLQVTGPDGEIRRARFADRGPYPFGHHVDRTELGRLLRIRAAELGATVAQGPVRDVVRGRGGRVTGVRHGLAAAATTTARLVIDASGPARIVADRAAGPGNDPAFGPARTVLRVGLRGLPDPSRRSVPLRVERLDDGSDTWLWVTPGRRDRGELTWSVPERRVPSPYAELRTLLRRSRVLGRSAPEARPEGRVVVAGGYRTRADGDAHGPGWVAAGDADVLSDPPLTGGASLAMIAAAPLAEAVHQVLTGRAAERPTMARYAAGVQDLRTDVLAFARACGATDSVAESEPDPDHSGQGRPGAGLDVLLCGTVVLRRAPAGPVLFSPPRRP